MFHSIPRLTESPLPFLCGQYYLMMENKRNSQQPIREELTGSSATTLVQLVSELELFHSGIGLRQIQTATRNLRNLVNQENGKQFTNLSYCFIQHNALFDNKNFMTFYMLLLTLYIVDSQVKPFTSVARVSVYFQKGQREDTSGINYYSFL